MLRSQIVMKKNISIKERNIKRETRNSSRKISTQEKIVLHMMNIMKAIVTHKEHSLWLRKNKKKDS
jgi:hypothetical protein